MSRIEVHDLDGGFDPSGQFIEGIIFNKSYSLSLIDIAPGSRVTWRLQVQGQQSEHNEQLPGKASFASLKVSDTDLCGRFIVVLACQNEQLLCKRSVWVHYRFRFFNRSALERELSERALHPWKIDQRSTALCGIACIFYLLASDHPDIYKRSILELHRTGCVLIHSYRIEPPEGMYEVDPKTNTDYPKGMALADWISLASVRSMESAWGYQGKRKEVFSAINWPPLMMRLSRKLLGSEKVAFRLFWPLKTYMGDLLFPSAKVNVLINQIQRAHAAGRKIIILIDMDLLNNRANYGIGSFSRYHWIVYGGGLRMEDRTGSTTTDGRNAATFYFQSYTWGLDVKNTHTTRGFSREAFITNFYGFLEIFSAEKQ
jgi:hypothetical protein